MGNTPIPVDGYKCPKCGLERVWKSFEEAQKHVDIKEDTPLPKGLVYFDKLDSFVVVADEGELNQRHSYIHRTLSPSYYTWCEHGQIDSKEFKYLLRIGEYKLAKPEKDMNILKSRRVDILRAIKAKEFVRTTPELEEMVAQEAVA